MWPLFQQLQSFLVVTLVLSGPVVAFNSHADFTQLCEYRREHLQSQNLSWAFDPDFVCGQKYAPHQNVAKPINVSLAECMAKSHGYEISNVQALTQWVGPLVGFLVPALAFVMSIPRPWRMYRNESLFGGSIFISWLWLVPTLGLMVLDVLLWIVVVFTLAGPIIIGAVHEALVDHYILNLVERMDLKCTEARAALSFTLVGSLSPEAGGLAGIMKTEIIESKEHGQQRLQAILTLLPSYGARVGLPVVFFLGAFAFAIIDAESRRGDDDTAHAIAFGIWYGVIVIAAIVSCSVLGVDNPAVLEAILGRVDVNRTTVSPVEIRSASWRFYDSIFMPISLWDRAIVFQSWTEELRDTLDDRIKTFVISRLWKAVSGLIACSLLTATCAVACYISYATPKVGFSCRSITVLAYLASQVFLVLVWIYFTDPIHRPRNYSPQGHHTPNRQHCILYYILKAMIIYFSTIVVFLGAALPSVGGSIMQLIGVYRNCVCKAGLAYTFIYDGGVVPLSTDTQEDRNGWKVWRLFGFVGIGFIGVVGVLGWFCLARVRNKCVKLIRHHAQSREIPEAHIREDLASLQGSEKRLAV